jgi:hypothetical protein
MKQSWNWDIFDMRKLLVAVFCSFFSTAASAQDRLTLVEGAACAHYSSQIEQLGRLNDDLLTEITEAQVRDSRDKTATYAVLNERRKALVALREQWMADYETKCARATMTLTNLTKICRTEAGRFPLAETAFCRPLLEQGL